MFRYTRILLLISLCVVGLAACDDDPATGPAPSAHNESTNPIFFFPDASGTMVESGTSTLKRDADGVTATFEASDLPEGAYTLWWVVWNNPSACAGIPCLEPDLFNSATNVDLGYATGAVVGTDGKCNMSVRLDKTELLAGFPLELGIASGNGLIDPLTAEVHLVLRSHGEVVENLEEEMIRTFNAGCVGMAPQWGTPGPNECFDIQFAIHQP